MKFTALCCLCGLVIALFGHLPVWGQAITRTPTQIELPSGSELLQRMQNAVHAAGTGRYTIKVPISGPWAALSIHEVDVSGAVHRMHSLDRERPPLTNGARGARYERIVVGKREAFRSTYGGWVCSVSKRLHADDFSLPQLPGTLTHIVTVGEVPIAGAIAWHVTARWSQMSSGSGEKDRLDFYIDQGSMLLLRQDRTTTFYQQGRAPVIGRYRIVYSNYGKPLHITLPKQC